MHEQSWFQITSTLFLTKMLGIQPMWSARRGAETHKVAEKLIDADIRVGNVRIVGIVGIVGIVLTQPDVDARGRDLDDLFDRLAVGEA